MFTSNGNPGRSRLIYLTFRNIDFVDITPADIELFKPFSGKRIIVTNVTTLTTKVSGTVSTPPQFKITNGTDDIVAAAANMHATQGKAKAATVIRTHPADYANPLTPTKTVAAAGTNPVMKGDVFIEALLVSDPINA